MNKSVGTLICLHGFLGQGRDWQSLLPGSWNREMPDLFAPASQSRWSESFQGLSEQLNSIAERASGPRVFMGYSLGGRIGLHALIEKSHLWAGGIFISTHPGLQDLGDRVRRFEADEQWARRFESEKWKDLMREWNSQSVFGGTPGPVRLEKEYSRSALAGALRGCSLGLQRDLRSELKRLELPILWVVGENDSKFLELARDVKRTHAGIELCVLGSAGHRAPWEQAGAFRGKLQEWLMRF